MLARFSEAFLVIRAQQGEIPIALVPLVMVAMNLAYALSAHPFGKLSDTMSHKRQLIVGLIVLIAADAVLAINDHWGTVLSGVILWGVHMGMTQDLLAAMIAGVSPKIYAGQPSAFSTWPVGWLCSSRVRLRASSGKSSARRSHSMLERRLAPVLSRWLPLVKAGLPVPKSSGRMEECLC